MKKEAVFPIIVLVLSVITLANLLIHPNYLAAINALIGIFGAILFFLKNNKYKLLFNIWIYSQFIVITKILIDPTQQLGTTIPVFDLTQYLELTFGINFTMDYSTYNLDFNFLPIVYLIAFKKLQINALVGEQLQLKLYRPHEILSEYLPQEVFVEDIIDFPKNKNWLFIELSTPIKKEDNTYRYAIVKSKEDVPIIKNETGQMAHLRLVNEEYGLKYKMLTTEAYPQMDWVFVS